MDATAKVVGIAMVIADGQFPNDPDLVRMLQAAIAEYRAAIALLKAQDRRKP